MQAVHILFVANDLTLRFLLLHPLYNTTENDHLNLGSDMWKKKLKTAQVDLVAEVIGGLTLILVTRN